MKCLGCLKEGAKRALGLHATGLQLGGRTALGFNYVPHHRLELRRHEVPRYDHVALEASDKSSHNAFRVTRRNPRAVLNQARDVLAIWAMSIMNLHSCGIEHRLHGQAPVRTRQAEHAPTKSLLLWIVAASL